MKKTMVVVGLSMVALLLGGCAEEKQGDYLPLEEVYAQANDALTQTYDNLTLPEAITLDQTDTLYTFTGTWKNLSLQTDDVAEMKAQMTALLQTQCGFTPEENDIKETYYGSSLFMQYGSDATTIYAHYECPYSFVVADYSLGDTRSDDTSSIINEVCAHIDRGDDLSASYELSDGSCTIADARALCDETVKKLIPYAHPEETELRTKTAFVVKRPNGKYQYAFLYEKLYHGIPLDSNIEYIKTDTGFSKPSYWYLIVDGTDHVSCVQTMWPNDYVSGSYKKCKDSFLSLTSAAKLLSTELAQYKSYRVTDIELQYASIQKLGIGPADDSDYRPMWCFILEENFKENDISPNRLVKTCAYVDMQNGKIYVVDDIYQQTYFTLEDDD